MQNCFNKHLHSSQKKNPKVISIPLWNFLSKSGWGVTKKKKKRERKKEREKKKKSQLIKQRLPFLIHVFFIYAIPHMCGWLACCRGKPSHSADTALPQELLNHSDVKWGPVLSHLCAYHQSTDSLFISTPWSGGRHPRSHWTLGLLPPEMMVSSLNSPITTNYSNTHKIDAHHDKTEYRNLIFT